MLKLSQKQPEFWNGKGTCHLDDVCGDNNRTSPVQRCKDKFLYLSFDICLQIFSKIIVKVNNYYSVDYSDQTANLEFRILKF